MRFHKGGHRASRLRERSQGERRLCLNCHGGSAAYARKKSEGGEEAQYSFPLVVTGTILNKKNTSGMIHNLSFHDFDTLVLLKLHIVPRSKGENPLLHCKRNHYQVLAAQVKQYCRSRTYSHR